MPQQLEYDRPVRRRNRATVAAIGLVLTGLLGAAQAQIHGTPPSVTSMGFGGRAINGTPPSVTSLGPRGYTHGVNPAFPNSKPWHGGSGGNPNHHPRRPQRDVGFYGAPYYGYYGVPYYGYDDSGPDAENIAPEDPGSVGPTVLDRRGGYIPPPPVGQSAVASSAAPEDPSDPSPPTVLVFKDGHQLEVENYAIVGSTLYDLTEGHRRKVQLADLDLNATSKQNDDRGIDFHLPAGAEAN